MIKNRSKTFIRKRKRVNSIPKFHKLMIKQRLREIKLNPTSFLDWEDAKLELTK